MAISTVIGWQIDNEPGHYGVVDYSENAQAKFRIWLQKKYGTIDKLNDTWGALSGVKPIRTSSRFAFPTSRKYLISQSSRHARFERFMADELAGFVNMQADILRRHIHKDQWITTNLIPIFNPVDPVRIDHPDFLTTPAIW